MIRILLVLLLWAAPALADPVRTAQAFLDGLSVEQRGKAWFRFDVQDRYDWHWVPRDRNGISLKELQPAQRELGFAMAGAVLSASATGSRCSACRATATGAGDWKVTTSR